MMSSVTISLLCLRLKRLKKLTHEEDDDQEDPTTTMRAAGRGRNRSGSGKAEYVHSKQQRIP